MKCNLKTAKTIRFEDLRVGDLFIEKGFDTICLKITALYDDSCADAECIEAIDITNGEAWRMNYGAEVFKLNGELNAEYV